MIQTTPSHSPRKLVCGGSFNPIHHGHLICARAVAESLKFDRIVLIPSARPPHKQASTELASAADRLAMCRLAIEGSDFFEVDDIEVDRTGPSYTIDTARELKRQGWPTVHWMIGADMVRILPQWHLAADLIREVQFIVIARPGWEMDWEALPAEYRHLRENVVQAPLIDISATMIRQRIASRQSADYLTPPQVVDYICKKQLYAGSRQ